MAGVEVVCEALLGSLLGVVDTVERPVTTSYVSVGAVAVDDCCGQLTVGPERMFRYLSFPLEVADAEEEYPGDVGAVLLVSFARCVPAPDDMGNPPSAEVLGSSHGEVLAEAALLWDAVDAFGWPDGYEATGLSQTFAGAEGGCVVVETRVTVGAGCPTWVWDG